MKKIISFLLISIILFGCSINFEKRRYRKGYYVDVVKNVPAENFEKTDTTIRQTFYKDETIKIDTKLNNQDSISKTNPHTPNLLKNKTKTIKMDQKVKQKPIFIPEKSNDKNIIKTKPENLPSPPEDDVLKKRKMWAWILGGASVLFFALAFIFAFLINSPGVGFILFIIFLVLSATSLIASLLVRFIGTGIDRENSNKSADYQLAMKNKKTWAWVLGGITVLFFILGFVFLFLHFSPFNILCWVLLGLSPFLVLTLLLIRFVKPSEKAIEKEKQRKQAKEREKLEETKSDKTRRIAKQVTLIISLVFLAGALALLITGIVLKGLDGVFYIFLAIVAFIIGLILLIVSLATSKKRAKLTND